MHVAQYRINIVNKKWYWPILSWLIDICVNNTWMLQRKFTNIPQLQFRREMASTYLNKFGKLSKSAGRPPSLTNKSFGRVLDDGMTDCIT